MSLGEATSYIEHEDTWSDPCHPMFCLCLAHAPPGRIKGLHSGNGAPSASRPFTSVSSGAHAKIQTPKQRALQCKLTWRGCFCNRGVSGGVWGCFGVEIPSWTLADCTGRRRSERTFPAFHYARYAPAADGGRVPGRPRLAWLATRRRKCCIVLSIGCTSY